MLRRTTQATVTGLERVAVDGRAREIASGIVTDVRQGGEEALRRYALNGDGKQPAPAVRGRREVHDDRSKAGRVRAAKRKRLLVLELLTRPDDAPAAAFVEAGAACAGSGVDGEYQHETTSTNLPQAMRPRAVPSSARPSGHTIKT